MNSPSQQLAPLPFLLVLLFLLLPFVEFSCQNQKLATLNGFETAFGTEVESATIFSERSVKEKIEGTNLLIGMIAACVLAAVAAWGKKGLLAAFLGITALVLLIVTPSEIDRRIKAKNQGVIVATVQTGFYACMVGLLAGIGLSLAAGMKSKDP
jgi:hypothetical protein